MIRVQSVPFFIQGRKVLGKNLIYSWGKRAIYVDVGCLGMIYEAKGTVYAQPRGRRMLGLPEEWQ